MKKIFILFAFFSLMFLFNKQSIACKNFEVTCQLCDDASIGGLAGMAAAGSPAAGWANLLCQLVLAIPCLPISSCCYLAHKALQSGQCNCETGCCGAKRLSHNCVKACLPCCGFHTDVNLLANDRCEK